MTKQSEYPALWVVMMKAFDGSWVSVASDKSKRFAHGQMARRQNRHPDSTYKLVKYVPEKVSE